VELEQARDGNRYGADVFEPNSIISIYNEPSTVLDVPRQASKKQVYGTQVVGEDGVLPAEKIMQLVIEPEYRDGKLRVKDCSLDIGVGPDGKAASLGEMRFALKDVATAQVCNKDMGLNGALEVVSGLTTNGHDVYAVMTFDNRLTLRLVRDACRLVSGVETEKGIRVEPPPAGQLYYRAFLPDETMRVRANRVNGQPWELRLTKTGTSVSGTVTRIEEVWPDEGAKPDLVPTDCAAATPEAVVPARLSLAWYTTWRGTPLKVDSKTAANHQHVWFERVTQLTSRTSTASSAATPSYRPIPSTWWR
jgi:hypothetical protein